MAEAFWNNVYSTSEYHYGVRPNEFIREKIEHYVLNGQWFANLGIDLPEELHVVELAAGEGRNAVWLARQGFQVTAFDLSDTAIGKAKELAARFHVPLETRTDDAIDLGLSSSGWTADVIVSSYFHVPPPRKRELLTAHHNLVRPGGLLIAEWFHPDQRRRGMESGGPPDPDMMITVGELRTAFADWLILECRERERTRDEGRGHQGPAIVTQFVAQKRGWW
jgi:2-polyprenyl-3-methyl-5-hydroxy-6-metoxy-1,4-benzoquinol methylase